MARNSRERLSRQRSQRKRKIYVLFVEGEVTEVTYFKELKKQLQKGARRMVKIKTFHPEADIHGLVAEAINYKPSDYHSIWVVRDQDDITVQDYVIAKQTFEDHVENNLPEKVKGGLLVSTPCFEQWLLFHFESSNAQLNGTQLEDRLSGYIDNMPNNLSSYVHTDSECLSAIVEYGDIEGAVTTSQTFDVIVDPETNTFNHPATDLHRLVADMLQYRKRGL